jgi:hypothetical protein
MSFSSERAIRKKVPRIEVRCGATPDLTRTPCMTRAFACLVVLVLSGAAQGQSGDPTAPPRTLTDADIKLLDTKFAVVKAEANRIGLKREIGRTCSAFVTADSVRPIETPLPLDGGTVTLPYASFLIWSPGRPFDSAVLYHVFGPNEAAYDQPIQLPPGTTQAKTGYTVTLAKREPFPSAADVARSRSELAAGPFIDVGQHGNARGLAVRPYLFPTQPDDPASVLPKKAERTLRITCLSDPDRVTNCLCAGTE